MRRGIAAILSLPVLLGCGGGMSAATDTSFPVTFILRTVDGASLPYSLVQNGVNVQVTADVVVLSSDGQFLETTTYRNVASGASQDQTVGGTWAQSGSVISLAFVLGRSGTVLGTDDGTTLSIVNGALGTWTYGT